ncbi:MAG TPA: cupin domain-containing protein [Candidatus Baltobacteraceae bacterium]|nr:cupin domain-containing protein [Candidatus Baltobacteraceae bacterium]
MHILRSVLVAFGILATAATAAAAPSPTVVLPGHESYGKPDMGASMAVLYGNPDKAGYYVVRMKVGAGWKFPPHFHPGRENVTVISGTFYAGMGSKWDDKKLTAFPAGSFISVPPGAPHFAMAKGPTVVDISGTEPLKDILIKK